MRLREQSHEALGELVALRAEHLPVDEHAAVFHAQQKNRSIGKVIEVKRDANDVVQTAFLLPAADLDWFESA